MDSIVAVNPFRCRVWHLHDRLEEHITEESCREEIESFLGNGQMIPALGRRLRNDKDHDIEIICGARRLFLARYTRKQLLVDVRTMTDKEAIIAMDIENRHRKDISPYERGRSYATYLRCGHFESQEDIARALNISPSVVSRLLKLARLPSVMVDAFGSAVDIREGWGVKLAEALDDPLRRRSTIDAARTIAASRSRPPARDVYRKLLSSAAPSRRGRPPKQTLRDRVVKDESGAPMFRIKHHRDSIALVLPLEHTPPQALEEIQEAICKILNRTVQPVIDRKTQKHQDLLYASA